MTRTKPFRLPVITVIVAGLAFLAGGPYCALAEPARNQSPSPVPKPSALPELERVLDRAIVAYNASDKRAFLAEFASTAPGILAEGAWRRLFEGYYKSEFGKLESKRIDAKVSVPDPDWGALAYDATFQKRPKARLIANFIRENGTVKLMQIRFDYTEPAK